MASDRRHGRIEPSFGASEPSDESDFRLSAEDRAVASGPSPARKRERIRERPEPAPKARRRESARGNGSGGNGGGGSSGGFFGRPRRRRSFLGHLVRLAILLVLWGGIAAASVVGYFAMKLPQEAWVVPDRPPNVRIVSVSGELLANRGTTGGEAVSLDEMSPYVPQAVMAIEDRRFYDHWGVDPIGILRAAVENLTAGGTVQGGSTLTQQLAKNVFLNPEQTIQRKIQEAILAMWLEHKFTKDQILEMYLNRVYFGSGATGVQAAARRYFDKNAKDLTLSESATLAGLLKAPSRLSPARDPEAAKARAEVVLQAMLEEKEITQDEFEAAKAEKPTVAKSFWTGGQHYAADMVMRDLPVLVGPITEDVVVETTIDLGLEKSAEDAIRKTIDGANQNVTQGALVSVDGTGAIRALIGGKDYADSQFNRAVDAKRQPGSSFKPFVYETALEYGVRPEDIVNDVPIRIGNWQPSNYDNKFRGPVTVADAVAKSLNTIAALMTEKVGSAAVIETAKRFGITSPLADNASIALGTSEVSLLEMTGAYATFANGGYKATPHLVNKVTTVSGKVLYERDDAVPPVIVTSDIVGMMNAMLTRVVTSGTGRRAQLEGWQVAGKSGTTQDFKDAWFIGYTSNLTTGVWLGNDNSKPMRKVTGGTLPADAWKIFMVAAHKGLPAVPLPGDYKIGDPANAPMASGYDTQGPRIIGYDQYGNPVYENPELPNDGYDQTAPVPPATIPGQDDDREMPIARQDPSQYPNYRRMPGYGNDGYASREEPAYGERDPYGQDPYGDDTYGGPPPDYGAPARMLPPGEIGPPRTVRRGELPPDAVLEGPARTVRRGDLPPDAVLEGPASGGRASDRSLFRDLFGG